MITPPRPPIDEATPLDHIYPIGDIEEDQHFEDHPDPLKIANRYGIKDDDPVWLLVRAVADAERAAGATSSAITTLESARQLLEALPARIEKSAADAAKNLEADLATWGTTAAALVSARLKTMLIELMPDVERHAKSSMNGLSNIVNALSIDITSIDAKMRAAFATAQSRYRDDIADTARTLIQAELIKTKQREHRKSLLHNAVALTIAGVIGAGLFFGFMVYSGQYSPLPVYRINSNTYDVLPSQDFGLSIQKCGGQPCVLIQRAGS
ncbi:MAG: hypothetical protein PHI71_11295 [Acidiphilium sp.]|nr:hypothetical protein [Acidiphilium sp.]